MYMKLSIAAVSTGCHFKKMSFKHETPCIRVSTSDYLSLSRKERKRKIRPQTKTKQKHIGKENIPIKYTFYIIINYCCKANIRG